MNFLIYSEVKRISCDLPSELNLPEDTEYLEQWFLEINGKYCDLYQTKKTSI